MTPSALSDNTKTRLKGQLLDRRRRLSTAAATLDQTDGLVRLLTEIDDALSHLEAGAYGDCQVCLTRFDDVELFANPLAAYCLCELTPERQRALEKDLQLAWRVQAALLPDPDLTAGEWRAHYRYIPFGPVSGDYCDLIVDPSDAGAVYFFVGDVSGKGVAASLLMSHLHAAFRAFVQTGVSLAEMVERASSLLAERSLATHYATLVCGWAGCGGEVEIVNAGHCAPVVVRGSGDLQTVPSDGMPVGLSLSGRLSDGYAARRVRLEAGDTLFMHTDGLTEAADAGDQEYGPERLAEFLKGCSECDPRKLVSACLRDLESFLNGAPRQDDLTLLALRRD